MRKTVGRMLKDAKLDMDFSPIIAYVTVVLAGYFRLVSTIN